VYEYYSSAAELIADVLVDEFAAWSTALAESAPQHSTPDERVRAWIRGVVDYVADGRHALLRAAGSIELPPERRIEVQDLHQSLIAPLVAALDDAGIPDPDRQARYVWGVVEVGISRIETGEAAPGDEAAALVAFVDGALGAPGRTLRAP
jgi:AcrR family transcriptional regulator